MEVTERSRGEGGSAAQGPELPLVKRRRERWGCRFSEIDG